MPPELQQRVHVEVELAKQRSGWPAGRNLAALGVKRTSYYRWLREEAWAKPPAPQPPPAPPYEALPGCTARLPASGGLLPRKA